MAQAIHCDLCGAGIQAAFLLTNLDSGQTQGICVGCAPAAFRGLAESIDQFIASLEQPSESADGADAQPETDSPGEGEKPATWPHTEHVVPAGRHRRKADPASAAVITAEQPETEPFS